MAKIGGGKGGELEMLLDLCPTHFTGIILVKLFICFRPQKSKEAKFRPGVEILLKFDKALTTIFFATS